MENNKYSNVYYLEVIKIGGKKVIRIFREDNIDECLDFSYTIYKEILKNMRKIISCEPRLNVEDNIKVTYDVGECREYHCSYKPMLENLYAEQQQLGKKTNGKKSKVIGLISLSIIVAAGLYHLPTIIKKINPYDGKKTKVPVELLIETPRPNSFDITNDNEVNEITADFANELNKKFKYKPEIEKLKDIVLLANGVYPFDEYTVEDASNLLISELNIVSAIAEKNAETTIKNEVSLASIVANPYYQDGVTETQEVVGKFKSESGSRPVRKLFNYMEERFNEQSYREASAMTRLLQLYQIDSRFVRSIKPSDKKVSLNELADVEEFPAKFYIIYAENASEKNVVYMPKIVKDEFENEVDTFFFDNSIENPELSDGICEEELREMGAVQEGWETLYQHEKDKARAEIFELSKMKCIDYEEYKAEEEPKTKSKKK